MATLPQSPAFDEHQAWLRSMRTKFDAHHAAAGALPTAPGSW